MLKFSFKTIQISLQSLQLSSFKKFSSLAEVGSLRSKDLRTLSENFRSTWPEKRPSIEAIESIPKRTVPDSALRFKLSATFDHGMAIFFPHLKFHPADFKVTLFVPVDSLSLSEFEFQVFRQMVGNRYNTGKRELKLTTTKFPNRIENKRYLVLLLENLLFETRKIASAANLK